MIVVDTSVFVDYFNGEINSETDTLDAILGNQLIVVGDLIAMELLQGFRESKDLNRVLSLFNDLEKREMITFDWAIKYAEMYRYLRSKGITIRKSIDTIIAGYCIIHNLPLLQRDRDFQPYQKYLGLNLL